MTIRLEELTFHAYHGVLPQEREQGNTFVVNVKAEVDDTPAVHTDNIHDTVDYSEIYRLVSEQMAIPSQLLEHVAGRILRCLKQRWPQVTFTVEVKKHNPPVGGPAAYASITVRN